MILMFFSKKQVIYSKWTMLITKINVWENVFDHQSCPEIIIIIADHDPASFQGYLCCTQFGYSTFAIMVTLCSNDTGAYREKFTVNIYLYSVETVASSLYRERQESLTQNSHWYCVSQVGLSHDIAYNLTIRLFTHCFWTLSTTALDISFFYWVNWIWNDSSVPHFTALPPKRP